MNVKKIIALYLRLSKHDKDIKEDMESNSIINQRRILVQYIKDYLDTEEYEVQEFVDDGFSGVFMERPAMQTLLKMAEEGKIYAILVKDLSRFSRNYLKSAYYMEKIFPALGIRFICVNDNYDSNCIAYQLPGMDMAFKGIVHDYYCKELSKKLKVARRQQVQKGKYIFAKPPYGYWKSEIERGILVIDDNTAPIVKDIFDQYIQGNSAYRIAQELNRKGIPSPNKRLMEAGLIIFRDEQYMKRMCWSNSMVLSILRNQIYIGDMVGGKEERIKVCNKNCKKRNKKEWIIVEKTHKPIIEEALFYQVQDILKHKTKIQNKEAGNRVVFSGRLVCSRCYATMTKSGRHKEVEYYSCPKCRKMGRKSITVHSDFLEKKILNKIVGHVIPGNLIQKNQVSMSDQLVKKKFEGNFQNPYWDSATGEVCGVQEYKKEKEKKQDIEFRSWKLLVDYERYVEGIITREEYEKKRMALYEKAAQEEKDLALQEKSIERAYLEKNGEVFSIDSKITYEIVDYYVEKIIVNGAKDINIEWKNGK